MVSVIVILFTDPSFSQPVSLNALPLDYSFTTFSYDVDNEYYPEDARPILKFTQPGAYLSVGAERGFIGAAIPGASALVLVDTGANVVFYNRINIALLKISEGRQDYLNLRLEASAEEIRKRVSASSLPKELRDLFFREEFTYFWL